LEKEVVSVELIFRRTSLDGLPIVDFPHDVRIIEAYGLQGALVAMGTSGRSDESE
jgi:hypothetical protein